MYNYCTLDVHRMYTGLLSGMGFNFCFVGLGVLGWDGRLHGLLGMGGSGEVAGLLSGGVVLGVMGIGGAW